MKLEEHEARMLRIAEGAALKNARGQNRQAKDHHRDDVIRAVGNSA